MASQQQGPPPPPAQVQAQAQARTAPMQGQIRPPPRPGFPGQPLPSGTPSMARAPSAGPPGQPGMQAQGRPLSARPPFQQQQQPAAQGPEHPVRNGNLNPQPGMVAQAQHLMQTQPGFPAQLGGARPPPPAGFQPPGARPSPQAGFQPGVTRPGQAPTPQPQHQQQQQQQQQQSLQPGGGMPRGHAPMQSIDLGMAGMDLNAAPGGPGGMDGGMQGGAAGPPKTKRSARAYHTDAAPDPYAGVQGGPGYPQQPQGLQQQQPQPNWQKEAAARAAASGAEAYLGGEGDAALDQIPGQRNTISPQQASFNQARMYAQQHAGQQQQPYGMGQQPLQQQRPGISGPGAGAGGNRPKIEPDQIPAPVEAQDQDQEFFDREWFATCGRGGLPLSTTDYAAVDQGNSNPKYMRLSTYSLPATDELAAASQLPIALVVQPLAQLRADEGAVPLVACPESGPPRCKKCRAYINPWFVFIEGGQKYLCNLCGAATECPPDYFCNLDMSGRRVDFDMRDELKFGTVEFEVPKEYWAIQAKPPHSALLPVAPASSITETARLTPKPPHELGASGGAAQSAAAAAAAPNTPLSASFTGSTLGMSGNPGAAAKLATKAASDALSNINSFALSGPGGAGGRTIVRAPRPMTYLFAIDVSFSAVRSGMLKAVIDSIHECLYGSAAQQNGDAEHADGDGAGSGFGLPHGSRVAFVTFDRSLHFWNLQASLDQAQMLVVGDIDEPFVPLSEGLLADPWESKSLVEGLLDTLPDIFADNMVAEAAVGSAVRGAQAALSTLGGHVSIFLSTIPTIGPGALKHREDPKLYATDKEKTLFVAQDSFYRTAGEECTEAGIGVDVFFFPSQYIDVATIGALPGLTGGDVFFHPRFDPLRDSVRLRSQIKRTLLRETGFNATLRIRASNGLRVHEHVGNFLQRNVTDLEMGSIDSDKAFACLIKHDGKLDEKQEAHFQCAILYTTADGARRVRCHNLAVPVTQLLGNVFRYADMDATVAYYTKEAVSLALTKPLKEVRHFLTSKCVKILLAYRRNCASSTSPGQLILPESFKLFPLYTLAMNKTKAIKGGNVTSDVRTVYMRNLRSWSVGNIMASLYPRMIALHRMAETDGFPVKVQDVDGAEHDGQRIRSPPLMRPSYMRMETHGAYLVDNSEMCIIWIGGEVNPKLLEDLYGVDSLDAIDPRMTTLPKLQTRLSQQVRNLVAGFARQRGKPDMPVLIARQGRDGTEIELANNLVEDQNNDAMSYVDYLCHVHRIITAEMSGTGSKDEEGSSIWKGW
ncbi:hypothetical protein K437DRAFT_274996 [Tilletiaria anomala UBC 951]|uniref:Beta-sandwich domain of Sec23/24 n=1 Tax=Tilletiaria anomala (strain ATCC 24038 / CBS 436.72 / UBC 951) TaxID=1037660 RepID=A0A066VS48_TILAU|nr:uncharacterized protein K437DRAFT_274996 [Tilletiaria anomala UBC 951]KDN43108.1 hypothetical protein K437DRAFT_274996 [Tilletiaria anomala UBC 951]